MSAAWGQQTPPPRNPIEDFAQDTLDKSLPRLRREPGSRPLFAVDPANVYPFAPDYQHIPPPLQESGSGGFALRAVQDHFQVREFVAGTVAILAPSQMTVLNANPGRANPFADLQPQEALMRFIGTLDKRQFALLTGAQGIGASDLNQRQRDLFMAALPEEMTVSKMKSVAFSPPEGGEGVHYRNDGEPITLAPAQRAAIRLQINRVPQYMFQMTEQKNSYIGTSRMKKPGEVWYTLRTVHSLNDHANTTAYGVVIKQTLPNRLKQGHLSFESTALNALVPLNGPVTINEMLARISKATGIEFLADRRVGVLPLWISDASRPVRSGDVLQALCLGVTGAFRRVGPVYLLTDDVEGLAPRVLRLAAWAAEAQKALQEEQTGFQERARKEDFGSLVGIAEDGFVSLPESARKQLSSPERQGVGGFIPIPLSALSSAEQQNIREMAARIQSQHSFDSSSIHVSAQTSLRYILPGYGVMESEGMYGGYLYSLDNALRSYAPPRPAPNTAPPPVNLEPAPLVETPNRALCIPVEALTNDEAAVKVMTEAARRGFQAVWVRMSLRADAGAQLARAINAAKPTGIQVGARVLLLDGTDAPPEQKDLTVFSETAVRPEALIYRSPSYPPLPSEWRRVDTPAATAALKKALLSLAETPGLSALILSDSLAPGYAAPPKPRPEYHQLRTEPNALGYTPEMRLMFLRKEGVDPLDAYHTGSYPEVRGILLQPPFFRFERLKPSPPRNETPGFGITDGRLVPHFITSGSPWDATQSVLEKWAEARAGINAAFMADLYTALRQKRSDLTLFLQNRHVTLYSSYAWFGSWDKPDALPQEEQIPGGNVHTTARKYSQKILVTVRPYRLPAPSSGSASDPARPTDPLAAWRNSLRAMAKNGLKDWDGLVLDLTNLPPEDTLAALTTLIAPKPGAA
jgi:hypothetical protein